MWLNENRGTEPMKRILICLATLALAGCSFVIGDSRRPIASETFAAPSASAGRPLVVVLPGFGVGVQGMKEHGVAKAIQDVWPEAEVQLADATFAYYKDQNLVARLREDIVAPAARAGRKIWLVGASLGGMGVLLYEREHPGELAGIILFAPFLGDRSLLTEIRDAGGPRAWNPGALPAELTPDAYQRQMWQMIKGWAERPASAPRVWLACGNEDRLLGASRLLADALPHERFFELKGGHAWDTWLIGGKVVFSNVRSMSL
jgi:pimeloyl-ACP methyl ester carboxylesterase